MRATKDALILDEEELVLSFTNYGKVHLYNKSKGDINIYKKALELYLKTDPKSRKAKTLLRECETILNQFKKELKK